MSDEFLNITELAARLGVRERVIAALVRQGKIPSVKIGKARRYHWPTIEALLIQPPNSVPVKIMVSPPVANGIHKVTDDTAAPMLTLPRGAKGKHVAEGN